MLVTSLGMTAVPVHVEPFPTTLSVIVNEPVVQFTVDVVACALSTWANPTWSCPVFVDTVGGGFDYAGTTSARLVCS